MVLAASATLVVPVSVPALASSPPAETAVSLLLNAFNGAEFNATSSSGCPTANQGTSCWWWSAVTFNALITYAPKNPDVVDPSSSTGATYKSEIEADLWTSYNTLCGTSCPTSADQRGTDPFTVNTNGNAYFDDIGWWTQTWINAYKLVGRDDYLYLAEQLWDYVTYNAFAQTPCNSGSGSQSGVVQAVLANGPPKDPDIYANSLYLRNSASLYLETKGLGDSFADQYMQGITYADNGLTYGGAVNEAAWIRQHLIFVYSGTVGDAGVQFMMADHYSDNDGACSPAGSQWELHGQGEMIQAWTDMAMACNIYGSCGAAPSYYLDLADELGRTIRWDYQGNANYGNFTTGNSPPYTARTPPSQTTATVYNGILAEPCSSPSSASWPYSCDLGTDVGTFAPFLISMGVFEEAISCLNYWTPGGDSVLANFISANAASISGLSNFGFDWQAGTGSNGPVNSATRTAVLDGLEANVGNSYAMC
jgi:hypothetical protein